MSTNSLQATEAECALGRTAPRVSLASMEAKIAGVYYVTGAQVIGSDKPAHSSLEVLTLCLVVMRNGFVLVGKSAPASAANFDAALGSKLAYEDAIRQLWPHEGYLLRERLADAVSA